MSLFDHLNTGISAFTTDFVKSENTIYKNQLFSSTSGPLITKLSIVISNLDSSSSSVSMTESGVVLAWDRGQFLANVSFYNSPRQRIASYTCGPIIGGT